MTRLESLLLSFCLSRFRKTDLKDAGLESEKCTAEMLN